MAKKTDIIIDEDTTTGEIFISGEPEANMPPPVPASHHIWYSEWEPIKFRSINKLDDMFPLIATVVAAVVLSATLLIVGIFIGAGL